MSEKRRNETPIVPYPSGSFVPERDLNSMPVLECSHLGIEFGGLKAVEDFNIVMGKTEIGGLIGPNGAGKTTIFNLLTKVYQPTHGTILVQGKDINPMTTAEVSRLGIARTFQNIRLFSNMTVEENVRIGLHNQVRYNMFSGILRLPSYWKAEKKQHQEAMELLEQMGLADRADAYPYQLSGGQQQRVSIARALAMNPKILFFDEPTSALDPELTGEILRVIRKLAEKKMTMVIVTHEMAFARDVSDYVVFMNEGVIVEQGPPREVIDHPTQERTIQFLRRLREQ